MKKFTQKLDAICAKLKEGLAGPLPDGLPINGVTHKGTPLTEHHESSTSTILNGSEASVPLCLRANGLDTESNNSQDETSEMNENEWGE